MPTLPDWFYWLSLGDWPFHILNAEHGKFGYIREAMAVYRVRRESYWTCRTDLERIEIEVSVYDALRGHFGHEWRALFDERLREGLKLLASEYDNEGDAEKAAVYTRRYVAAMLRAGRAPGKRYAAALLRLFAPSLYRPLRHVKRAILGAG
jgi:hypothetical protein